MILLLSGSSCSGKNTLIKYLVSENKDIKYIQSFSSREKRIGESDGDPYFFISKEEFQKKIKNNDFFEHELIHKNFYGVEKNKTKNLLAESKHLIKDMGVIGTFNLKEELSDSLVETVFLYVDKKTLKKRLRKRGDSPKQIKLRMKRFKMEKSHITRYNFVIDNTDKEKTLAILKKIFENNTECSNYIKILKNISDINLKKLNKNIDKLIDNRVFKPIKILFNGQDFYLKNNVEKYLAGLITKKNVTKKVLYKNVHYSSFEDIENVKNLVDNFIL